MREMLYPTSYLKSMGLGKVCALVTDGRFSGGSSGPHRSRVARSGLGSAIGLIENGDTIEIDIPNRINLTVSGEELAPPQRHGDPGQGRLETRPAGAPGVGGARAYAVYHQRRPEPFPT